MQERFKYNSGVSLTFTDDSITWESSISRLRFPYGSIKQVKIGILGFEITPCEGNTLTFAFHRQYKPLMQQMLAFTQNAMRNALPTKPINLTAEKNAEKKIAADAIEKERREIASKYEHRMRCNVCGRIFCYTDADVRESQSHQNWAKAHAAASLFGTRLDAYGQQSRMDSELSKVVDYSRCPACHSNNITEIKDGEATQPAPSAPVSPTSPIEEIKKFKELLDMGIITQEEFDAKKKQLLGL